MSRFRHLRLEHRIARLDFSTSLSTLKLGWYAERTASGPHVLLRCLTRPNQASPAYMYTYSQMHVLSTSYFVLSYAVFNRHYGYYPISHIATITIMFRSVPPSPADPVYLLSQQVRNDTSPLKVDLGVGVYRNKTGAYHELRALKAVRPPPYIPYPFTHKLRQSISSQPKTQTTTTKSQPGTHAFFTTPQKCCLARMRRFSLRGD